MSKTYCGACRGERGCEACPAIGSFVQYTGVTEFYAEGAVSAQSEKDVCVSVKDADPRHKELLLAADLGTTTLAFVCADEEGCVRVSYSCENPQRRIASDVVGRMDAALHGQGESLTDEIREALVKGFLFVLNRGLAAADGKATGEMPVRIAIAGNTVMQHILLGYPLETMAKSPFVPYKKETKSCSFSELFGNTTGFAELPESLARARVTVFPCLSAFVGGDMVAGANAVFAGDKKRCMILIDLGTNGEILLTVKGRWYGTAAAMGSAFEGGRYAYASELFRKMAEALKQGIADETGLLSEPYFSGGYEGLLQEDVREFQLAKGALRAGIELLCRHVGVPCSEIDRVYVAGGFGRFCESEDLFITGLLPKVFSEKVAIVGNSCMGGMLSYLKNKESVIYCEGTVLNLAEQPEFEELYYRFMNFEE